MAVIALPLAAMGLMTILSHRLRPSVGRWIGVTAVGLAASGLVALFSYVGELPSVGLEWLPGTGQIGLALTYSGLIVASTTVLAAFFVQLGTLSGEKRPRSLSDALTLLALVAAILAFLVDHFLARYVALEIVALCVALVALVELRDENGVRTAWRNYLLLRLGDVGLLTAILILGDAGGTLNIDGALAAGVELDGARLTWVVLGIILVTWVKLGGWPFHIWVRTGNRLSLASHTWMYATLMSNLGIYLLYRTVPILREVDSLAAVALWLGAGGALVGGLLTVMQDLPRRGLVYVGASLCGLLLFTAAVGPRSAVWLALVVLTPVRLLLYLASDAAQKTKSAPWHKALAALFGLGGGALIAFGLLIAWWTRAAGPVVGRFLIDFSIAALAAWTVRMTWRLFRSPSEEGEGVGWDRGVVLAVLAAGILVGGVGFGPVVRTLSAVEVVKLPGLPSLGALLEYVATTPAFLLSFLMLLILFWSRGRIERASVSLRSPKGEDLQGVLIRLSRGVWVVVEVNIVERIVAFVPQAVINGARFLYRFVEQEGLEGLVRRAVRGVLSVSRALQRWHTGKLRHNLAWAPLVLLLAVLLLVVLG